MSMYAYKRNAFINSLISKVFITALKHFTRRSEVLTIISDNSSNIKSIDSELKCLEISFTNTTSI